MSAEYSEHLAAAWRLWILIILRRAAGYESNAATLQEELQRQYGQRLRREQVEGELAWLAAQGLVARRQVGGLTMATLTTRGLDVSLGNGGEYPGVRSPRPEDL